MLFNISAELFYIACAAFTTRSVIKSAMWARQCAHTKVCLRTMTQPATNQQSCSVRNTKNCRESLVQSLVETQKVPYWHNVVNQLASIKMQTYKTQSTWYSYETLPATVASMNNRSKHELLLVAKIATCLIYALCYFGTKRWLHAQAHGSTAKLASDRVLPCSTRRDQFTQHLRINNEIHSLLCSTAWTVHLIRPCI